MWKLVFIKFFLPTFLFINYLLSSARNHKFGRQSQANMDEDDDGDGGGGEGYNGYAEGTGDMAGNHAVGYSSVND